MHPIDISKRFLKRYLKRSLRRSMRAIALRARAAWPRSRKLNAQPQVGPEDLEMAERHVAQAEKIATGWRDIVAQREAEGGDASVARLILRTFEAELAARRQQRDLIKQTRPAASAPSPSQGNFMS
jgi:hypothetical protein